MTSVNQSKQLVANYLAKTLENEEFILCGSGSTVNEFIKALPSGISLVSASRSTSYIAYQTNHHVVSLDSLTENDSKLCVDGADQILPNNIIIKGHGGALFHEKILWREASRIYIAIDESKISDILTKTVPVVISPFAPQSILEKIQAIDGVISANLLVSNNLPFTTDDNMMICHLNISSETDLTTIDHHLHNIAGVVETGIFLPGDYNSLIICKAGTNNVELIEINQSL